MMLSDIEQLKVWLPSNVHTTKLHSTMLDDVESVWLRLFSIITGRLWGRHKTKRFLVWVEKWLCSFYEKRGFICKFCFSCRFCRSCRESLRVAFCHELIWRRDKRTTKSRFECLQDTFLSYRIACTIGAGMVSCLFLFFDSWKVWIWSYSISKVTSLIRRSGLTIQRLCLSPPRST